MVTSAVGSEFSRTVNVAVPPASVVTRPVVGVMVMSAVSLSVLIPDTSAASKPLYLGSLLVAAAVTIEKFVSPSSTKSFTPVSVTVWGLLQLLLVKTRLAGETTASVGSLVEMPMVTSAVGRDSRLTAKTLVPPDSVVNSPECGFTLIPGADLTPKLTEVSCSLAANAFL